MRLSGFQVEAEGPPSLPGLKPLYSSCFVKEMPFCFVSGALYNPFPLVLPAFPVGLDEQQIELRHLLGGDLLLSTDIWLPTAPKAVNSDPGLSPKAHPQPTQPGAQRVLTQPLSRAFYFLLCN